MDDKVMVTHRGVLKAKYGAKGFARITTAVRRLIVADRKRGLETRIVYLDDVAEMKHLRAKPMLDPGDCRAAKTAIDGVYRKLKPDYLLILGSHDVVPHQDLANPAFNLPSGDGDDDPEAWGDLPYACDTPYSRDTAQFVGPTRVVGRLPDLTGATEPSHLLKLIATAVSWKGRYVDEYMRHFALSAYTWHRSTRRSLRELFGTEERMLVCPPRGPHFRRGELRARMHLINCHGGLASPEFVGQKGSRYPRALTTRSTVRAINEGTVAAVECCYGAELYDSVTLGIDMPICQSYLGQGTYGYFGSTTVAYGSDGKGGAPNSAADLLCTYFLQHVLAGASIGRAALMARQQLAGQCDQADPIDLKTLAQFCLYGDPGVHPVRSMDTGDAPAGVRAETVGRFRRSQRRAKLRETGRFLKRTKPTASQRQKGVRMTSQARTALASIARRGGLPAGQPFAAFAVRGARRNRAESKAAAAPSRYYLAIGRPRTDGRYRVVVIAKELNGRVVDYRIYNER